MLNIPLLDIILENLPWNKSKEYEKLEGKYGVEVKKTIWDLIVYPLLKIESIPDLAYSVNRNKNDYYDLMKDQSVDWLKLLQEITYAIFLSILIVYHNNTDESWRSRHRIRLITDDTILRRFSKYIAESHKVYNSIDHYFCNGQKMLVLAVSIGEDHLMFPILSSIQHTGNNGETSVATIAQAIDTLCESVKRDGLSMEIEDLSMEGVRLVGDSAFSCGEIAKVSRKHGLQFYGTARASWVFTLPDGTKITCGELKRGEIPKGMNKRYSSELGTYYYRCTVSHETLGDIALAIIQLPQKEGSGKASKNKKKKGGKKKRGKKNNKKTVKKTKPMRFYVHFSTDLNVRCAVMVREHRLRVAIELMFKYMKHVLAIKSCQCVSGVAQNAWIALTALRFLLARLMVQFTKRYPSLRGDLSNSQCSLRYILRYFRNNYHLSATSLEIKHLHYDFVSRVA